jgi:hypothetical protein
MATPTVTQPMATSKANRLSNDGLGWLRLARSMLALPNDEREHNTLSHR